MDQRYEHPTVKKLWSPEWTYGTWHQIELAVLEQQRWFEVVNRLDTDVYFHEGTPRCGFNEYDIQAIRDIEKDTRHDVAAFIQYMREWYGEPHGRWYHYGLTSSDLIETAQGIRFAELITLLETATGDLISAVGMWTKIHVPTLGRTHGQPAEPITISHRASGWLAHLRQTVPDLLVHTRRMARAKLSGPVGTFAHNPPEIESGAASKLNLEPWGPGASQVIPRADLAAWANQASLLVRVLNKIATDLRLMNMLGEVTEGQGSRQVGSSAMPHKNNPIRLEQIGGMARLAAGYASMLQPIELWMERDISNSSVERVAVPDLWHVLLYSVDSMTRLLTSGVEFDPQRVQANLYEAGHLPYTSQALNVAIWAGDDYDDARSWSTSEKAEMEMTRDPAWHMRNSGLGAS